MRERMSAWTAKLQQAGILLILSCAAMSCSPDAGLGTDSARVTECPEGFREEPCDIYFLINKERQATGIASLRFDPSLGEVARFHASEMHNENYLAEETLDGRTFEERVGDSDFQGEPLSQDITSGKRDSQRTFDFWMTSEAYRRHILSTEATHVGIGYEGGVWVQILGAGTASPSATEEGTEGGM